MKKLLCVTLSLVLLANVASFTVVATNEITVTLNIGV